MDTGPLNNDGLTNLPRHGESGLTLVGLLVTTAVTALLATALATTIHQITTVTVQQRKLSESRGHLLYAMNSIVDDLRSAGRQTERWKGDVHYRLFGLDGDGTFENSTLNDARPSENENVDRLYFHALLGNGDIGESSGRASVGYFLSPKENKAYREGTWRLIRYRLKHNRGHSDNGNLVPTFDTDIGSVTGTNKNPVAARIDRLSFRYRSEDGNWYNTWDSDQPALPQVDEEGDLPVAVEVAVRSYTPSPSGESDVDPQWRTTIVSLR